MNPRPLADQTTNPSNLKSRSLLWGAFAVTIVVLLGLLMPRLAWTGGSWFELKVHVKDGRTPMRGAKVRVIPWRDISSAETLLGLDERFPAVVTDTNGVATVKVKCGAGGGSFLFWRTGRIIVQHELHVESAGYRPILTPLENILGRREWPLSKSFFEVDLLMLRDLTRP
jgi:hypothetical protein